VTRSGDDQGWGPVHALLPGPPVAAAPVGASGPPPERGTWALSRQGLSTVIRLELRQRVRSSRWLLMLGIWFGTIGVIFGLTLAVIGGSEDAGAYLFGAIAFLVLTLGMLVAPALSATSINGDRSAGTLATLQMTLLSPAEIAVGKLLAAWGTALVFLAVGSPFLLVSLALGGTSLPRAVVTLLMLSLILLTVCGIALGWSALTARLASSAVLTYLSVAFLCLGTLVFFGLSVPLVQTEDEVQVLQTPESYDFSSSTPLPRSDCEVVTAVRSRTHTEYTWWLLAANPYVVVADAAPRSPDSEDVLSLIGLGARTARDGARGPVDECFAAAQTSDDLIDEPTSGPVWPIGLALNLVLGGLGLTLAVLRLRTPVGTLPRGTRIA
jgi:ABC-type transport system involved in cytochrome c biogenesis permease component